MRAPSPLLAAALTTSLLACASAPPASAPPAPAPPPAPTPPRQAAAAPPAPAPPSAQGPATALPYTPGLDPAAMDRTVDPCVDFYEYSCGGWRRRNPIPADQASWSVYAKLADDNLRLLWGLLESAARADSPRTAPQQKIGDYYAACMDERALERAGTSPLAPDLAGIAALRSKAELGALLGRLHRASVGSGFLFDLGSEQDARDATQVIGAVSAGGLGLPDRDFYLQPDARSAAIRARYLEHVARMLELVGDAPAAARAGAAAVVRIETALARASLSRVERRDPHRVYHRLTPRQLAALVPTLRWKGYFAAAGTPPLRWLNVSEPAFMREVEALLRTEPLPAWRSYLRWHLADAAAPYLSQPLQRASFEFHAAFLQGVKEDRPRWKKCVAWVDRDLGEALGQVYVARIFPPGVKGEVTEMVRRIEAAMAIRIRQSTWMTEPTRRAALQKLSAVREKIGYPARWRDYGALRIAPGDFYGNVERSLRFETARQLAKIGRPVDRDEWQMTPPTVNAYYDQQLNDVNFPAGVLLPPLYDPGLDAAPGYGNTGGTIGHELTHGFDDEGRKFDAAGNLRDWWTADDAAAFQQRASCVAEQYGQYPAVDDLRINSQLTLGEDVADLGGTLLAWMAWRDATRGQALAPRDGLTPEQRFFVGYAQWACENATDEVRRVRAVTDPHSPPRWRVNGVMANLGEFRAAFQCRAGQPLVRERPCVVW